MDATKQPLLPPRESTTTFTIPVEVELGAEMVGPGMVSDGGGSQPGTDGDFGGEVGPGAGAGRATISYLLINFHCVYFEDAVKYVAGFSTNTAWELQSSTPRNLEHPAGLLAATISNDPLNSPEERIVHI